MHFLAPFALAFTVLFETSQQFSFKQATRVSSRPYVWLITGAALYVPQLICWFFTLTLLPLSIAAPLLGTSYVTVPLASGIIFKEKVSKRRWLGILLIVVGLALISREMPA